MINHQSLETDVVRQAVKDAGDSGWQRLRAGYVRLGAAASLDFVRVTEHDERQVEDTMLHMPFDELREAMADEHGAWFSAELRVESDLRYEFSFNYDHEPAWGDGRPVLPESLLADLQRFPRPWAEIPEWHPAKQKYTEETWATETRKF